MASERVTRGMRVGLVTIVVNLALAAVKAAAGLVGRSYALVADGIESLTDIGTTVGFLAALRLGDRPPDTDHPYGHRRVESELTRLLTLGLIALGLLIGWQSVRGLGRATRPDWIAPGAALLSIVVKEWMFHYTVRAGRRLGSPALVANAWHHRSDALTSVATLFAVIGAILGWPWLDPLAGLVVAVVIIWVAGRLYWQATRELVDTAPPRPVMRRLLEAARQTPGVQRVHRLRARLHGERVLADVVIAVDPGLTVERGHDIAESVEQALHRALPELADVTVHVEPGDVTRSAR
ncbi:MAG TPA: cation diffusion facilitator family transporter [Limnochordales bacterium]